MAVSTGEAGLASRIEGMFTRDRAWAWGFVVALWIVVVFVMVEVSRYVVDGGIIAVGWISAAVLLIFNTASIFALVRHYAHDKQHIYSVDIKHLDAGR